MDGLLCPTGRAARAGAAAWSILRDTSGVVLDFLLVNSSALYSGRASKKSTFSGMSVSFHTGPEQGGDGCRL